MGDTAYSLDFACSERECKTIVAHTGKRIGWAYCIAERRAERRAKRGAERRVERAERRAERDVERAERNAGRGIKRGVEQRAG